jgi:hypothetical protein
MSQNYKNDDLEYVLRNNQTNKTFVENITKKPIHNTLQDVNKQNNVEEGLINYNDFILMMQK